MDFHIQTMAKTERITPPKIINIIVQSMPFDGKVSNKTGPKTNCVTVATKATLYIFFLTCGIENELYFPSAEYFFLPKNANRNKEVIAKEAVKKCKYLGNTLGRVSVVKNPLIAAHFSGNNIKLMLERNINGINNSMNDAKPIIAIWSGLLFDSLSQEYL